MFTKNEIFNWFGNYNYQFAVARFLVDSKTDSNRKECMNPLSLEILADWSVLLWFVVRRQRCFLSSAAHLGLIIILRYIIHLPSTCLFFADGAKKKSLILFISVRWCTNEMWERLIWTDALWSKVRVSCRRTCLVSYSWQGRGEGMGNDE